MLQPIISEIDAWHLSRFPFCVTTSLVATFLALCLPGGAWPRPLASLVVERSSLVCVNRIPGHFGV